MLLYFPSNWQFHKHLHLNYPKHIRRILTALWSQGESDSNVNWFLLPRPPQYPGGVRTKISFARISSQRAGSMVSVAASLLCASRALTSISSPRSKLSNQSLVVDSYDVNRASISMILNCCCPSLISDSKFASIESPPVWTPIRDIEDRGCSTVAPSVWQVCRFLKGLTLSSHVKITVRCQQWAMWC